MGEAGFHGRTATPSLRRLPRAPSLRRRPRAPSLRRRPRAPSLRRRHRAMAARLRLLGLALSSSAPKIMGSLKNLRPLPNKEEMASYVKKRWSKISQENRSMMKQSFVNLTVPAVYTGVAWLVSKGVDIVKGDQSPTHPQSEALKKELDEKVSDMFKAIQDSSHTISALKEQIAANEQEIRLLRERVHEKDAELAIFKEILAGRMREVGVLWFKHFAKNLSNTSLLPYYEVPENNGLIYWR